MHACGMTKRPSVGRTRRDETKRIRRGAVPRQRSDGITRGKNSHVQCTPIPHPFSHFSKALRSIIYWYDRPSSALLLKPLQPTGGSSNQRPTDRGTLWVDFVPDLDQAVNWECQIHPIIRGRGAGDGRAAARRAVPSGARHNKSPMPINQQFKCARRQQPRTNYHTPPCARTLRHHLLDAESHHAALNRSHRSFFPRPDGPRCVPVILAG